MKRISGHRNPKREETFFQEDRLKKLDKNPELELPEKDNLNLVEYFHWHIMKNRRRRGLTQKKLAENLGESEVAIQMLESEKLPENAEILINKLEQLFQIKLRNIPKQIQIKEPILLNEKGEEIEILPEEEMVFIDDPVEEEESDKEEDRYEEESEELEAEFQLTGDLDLKQINQEKVTIGDLQGLHKKTINATRQEQIEEQKKIEERQKILFALRERDRIKMEKMKQQGLIEKQRSELAKLKSIEEEKQRLEKMRKQEFQEFNRHLGGVELLDSNNNNQKDNLDSENVKEFDDELV